MAVDVIMPQMGESIFEGTITKWLKKPGDKVERDEPLFEISTDKVDAEIPAPAAGVLKEIKVSEGQTVPIQTVVAVIDAAGAATAAAPPAAPAAPAKAEAPAAAAKPAAAPAPVAAKGSSADGGQERFRGRTCCKFRGAFRIGSSYDRTASSAVFGAQFGTRLCGRQWQAHSQLAAGTQTRARKQY